MLRDTWVSSYTDHTKKLVFFGRLAGCLWPERATRFFGPWDCDSYKSPGSDGVNFCFFKEFWADMKHDIMRFMVEFHRNGKLQEVLIFNFYCAYS